MRIAENYLLAGILVFGAVAATAGIAQSTKTPKPITLKPANSSNGPASSDVTVPINQTYTDQMATQANLDLKKPKLSTDGFLSQDGTSPGTTKLASAECLLSQTILSNPTSNPGLSVDRISSICDANASSKPTHYETFFQVNTGVPVIDYALIHIVRWDPPPHGGVPAPAGTWYLFERKALRPGSVIPWTNVSGISPITSATHLLGDKNVAFMAIHLGIDTTCGISYDIKATHTTPLNRQDVTSLIQTAISIFGTNTSSASKTTSKVAENEIIPPPPSTVGVWGGTVILQQQPQLPENIVLTPSMTGTIRAFVAKEKGKELDPTVGGTCSAAQKPADAPVPAAPAAANSPKLSYFGSMKSGSALRSITFESSSYAITDSRGVQSQAPAPVASSQTKSQTAGTAITGNTSKDPLSALSQTIPNEGAHHWDVSIAMPVTSYKSLKYDSTNGLLVPKTTTSVNPYALFDFYPDAVDLAAYSGSGIAISMPKITAGIPIGNQPLQKPFVGTGFVGTIKSFRFQPIVGLHIQKEVRADSATSTLTHTEWHAKLQVMIGFSISDARKVLGIK